MCMTFFKNYIWLHLAMFTIKLCVNIRQKLLTFHAIRADIFSYRNNLLCIFRFYQILYVWMSHPFFFFSEVFRGLMKYQPDIIISVHPLMQHVPLRILRAKGLLKKIVFTTVITDLSTCHPTWLVLSALLMFVLKLYQ